jgi:hypothetical protein
MFRTERLVVFMGVCQGVAMDFLKSHHGVLCPTFLRHAGGPPIKRPTAVSGVACAQSMQPKAIFYPLDTPRRTPLTGRVLVLHCGEAGVGKGEAASLASASL